MKQCLHLFGVEADDASVGRIISSYDLDDSGTIEESEFVQWMIGAYMRPAEAELGRLVDRESGADWVPPDEARAREKASVK